MKSAITLYLLLLSFPKLINGDLKTLKVFYCDKSELLDVLTLEKKRIEAITIEPLNKTFCVNDTLDFCEHFKKKIKTFTSETLAAYVIGNRTFDEDCPPYTANPVLMIVLFVLQENGWVTVLNSDHVMMQIPFAVSGEPSITPVIDFFMWVTGPRKRTYLTDDDNLKPGDGERNKKYKGGIVKTVTTILAIVTLTVAIGMVTFMSVFWVKQCRKVDRARNIKDGGRIVPLADNPYSEYLCEYDDLETDGEEDTGKPSRFALLRQGYSPLSADDRTAPTSRSKTSRNQRSLTERTMDTEKGLNTEKSINTEKSKKTDRTESQKSSVKSKASQKSQKSEASAKSKTKTSPVTETVKSAKSSTKPKSNKSVDSTKEESLKTSSKAKSPESKSSTKKTLSPEKETSKTKVTSPMTSPQKSESSTTKQTKSENNESEKKSKSPENVTDKDKSEKSEK